MKITSRKGGAKDATVILLIFIFQIFFLTFVYGAFPWYCYLIITGLVLVIEYFCAISNRSYILDQSGVTVYWFGRFSYHYCWEEFQTIRVATIKIRMRDWHYPRCLILSKYLLPNPLIKADYSWFERHPFSALLFEFTPERYVEFCEKFPNIKLEWEREDIGW